MGFNDERLKLYARELKETVGDEAASDVHLALLSTTADFRDGKLQILTVNLCQVCTKSHWPRNVWD